MTQTLSVGKPLAEKYVEVMGYTGVRMTPYPTQMLMCLVGRSGEGKSYFWQSCPHALILNMDCTSTSYAGLKAHILPGVRKDGQPVVPDPKAPLLPNGSPDPEKGVPFDLNWDWMLQQQNTLLEMAAQKVPQRPRMIVIDTADVAYPLCKDWMLAQWNKEHSMLENKSKFSALGYDAWPESYETLLKYGLVLRRAGYGVCFNFQLDDKLIHLDVSKKEWLRDVPRVPDNCYQTIKGHAEMLIRIELSEEEKIERFVKKDSQGKEKINAVTGKPLMATRVVGKERRAVITMDATRSPRIAKQRINLPPRIVLPVEDPYSAFEKAYLEAAGLKEE